MGAYLVEVVRSIALEVHGAPDLEVGLTIQIGGLDEADLQNTPGLATNRMTSSDNFARPLSLCMLLFFADATPKYQWQLHYPFSFRSAFRFACLCC